MDKIHNGVLRKFHTLCSRLGLTAAEKRAIVESFGVESVGKTTRWTNYASK